MGMTNICPLWLGGRCPVCDDEWCDLGISPEEAERINAECCASHRDPTDEELSMKYKTEHKEDLPQ